LGKEERVNEKSVFNIFNISGQSAYYSKITYIKAGGIIKGEVFC